jgi:hypothetical protein
MAASGPLSLSAIRFHLPIIRATARIHVPTRLDGHT